MSAADLLADARGVLVERGWLKGDVVAEDGRVCAFAALAVADNGIAWVWHWSPTAKVARDFLSDAACSRGYNGAAAYNDAKATTFTDVLAMYDDAILAAKEAGQ